MQSLETITPTERKHHYGHEVLSWNGLKLMFQKEVQVELIPHETIPAHWHLKFGWKEGITPEFFNIFNARENARRICLYHLNYDA